MYYYKRDPEKFVGLFTLVFSTFLITSAVVGLSYSAVEMTKFTVPVWIYVMSILVDVFTLGVGICGFSSVFSPAKSSSRYLLTIAYTAGLVALFIMQMVRFSLAIFATSITIFSDIDTRNARFRLGQYIAFGIITALAVGCCSIGIGSACYQFRLEHTRMKKETILPESYSSIA